MVLHRSLNGVDRPGRDANLLNNEVASPLLEVVVHTPYQVPPLPFALVLQGTWEAQAVGDTLQGPLVEDTSLAASVGGSTGSTWHSTRCSQSLRNKPSDRRSPKSQYNSLAHRHRSSSRRSRLHNPESQGRTLHSKAHSSPRSYRPCSSRSNQRSRRKGQEFQLLHLP